MRAFGWTHDQYLDTPHEARDWLLHIDDVVKRFEAEQQENANRAR